MKSEIKVSCPICQGVSRRATQHTPFAYWRCEGCGTAHLHPKPSGAFLSDYYENYHQRDEMGGVYEQFEVRTEQDFPRKAQIVAGMLSNGSAPRVLDVGCGKGFFVKELQKRQFQVEGIDLSATAVEAGTRSGVPGLRSGRIEEQRDWNSAFDAVTCFATIEHLLDPHTFVREIRRVLKPGGFLFMDTGVGNNLLDRSSPGFVQWYDPPQHIFVFSTAGMERLLRDCGFEAARFDRNFERNQARRWVKIVRNYTLALSAGFLFRAIGGRSAWNKIRSENKMPFGSLMFVIARARV
jgi:SAM-dependent methyltransferase